MAEKLSTEVSPPLGYTSLFLTGALSYPFLMESIGLSPAWYLSIATIMLTYFKSDKNRKDHKSAIQVVSDYNVINTFLFFFFFNIDSFHLILSIFELLVVKVFNFYNSLLGSKFKCANS